MGWNKLLISFLRWIKGYLVISLLGYSPERFLNLLKHKGIKCWDITPCENSYRIKISLDALYELKPIARKTGVKIRIIEKQGLPFVFQKLKSRKAFGAGVILCIAILLYSRCFIWDVQIQGNHMLTEDVIMTYLKENGIKIGKSKRNIMCNQLVKDIRTNFPQVVWSTAFIDGTVVYIEIEEKENEIINTNNHNGNIVAEYDGRIVKMITRSGVPMVSVGDTIKKGDVLVSEEIIVGESTQIVIPDADIWIETEVSYYDEIQTIHSFKTYSDKIKYGIWFHWNDWNAGFGNINNDQSLIEIMIDKKPYYSIIKKKKYNWNFDVYDEETRTQKLQNNLNIYCKELEEKQCDIVDHNIEIQHYSNKSEAIGTIRLIYLHKI